MAKPNFVDQRFILIENNEYLKAEKADGTEAELIKLSAQGKPEFPEAPVVGASVLATEAVVDSKVLEEKGLRETADASLQFQIDSLSTGSGSSITFLEQALQSEAQTRASGDEFLELQINQVNVNLNQEITDRIGAVNYVTQNLGDMIVSAQQSFGQEVTRLDSRIDNVVSNIDPAALDSLSEIVTAFQSADSTINGAISSLAASASSDLQAEATRATAAEVVLDGKITQEIADRSAADTVLDGKITQEIADRTAADAGKASTTLGNLGTTAINADLLPSANGARNFGSSTLQWNKSHSRGFVGYSGGGSHTFALDQHTSPSGVANVAGLITLPNISGSVIFTANATGTASKPVLLETGNSLTANLNSGDVKLYTGTVSGTGVRGEVSVVARQLNMNSVKVVGLADGVASTDAVNKGQVDVAISGATSPLSASITALQSSKADVTYVQSEVATVNARIDGVISNVDPAALDSLSEVVSAFQAADSTINGAITSLSAFASSALQAEVTRATSAEAALDGRVAALEADALEFHNMKIVLTSGVLTAGYVDLDHQAIAKSIVAFVNRLGLFETEDFTLSVVEGKTRVAFTASIASQLEAGDALRFHYHY